MADRGLRLEGRVAVVVVGAGQSPGPGIGNGRATALRFAQEGARVLAVDRDPASAQETVGLIEQADGKAVAFTADVTRETTLHAAIESAVAQWGRLDILHNNVGASIGAGDTPIDDITEEALDRVYAVNLRGAIMAVKHALPHMRAQRSGVIINISSTAAWMTYPNIGYKAAKAGLVAFTRQVAVENARFGVRANAILPGLMNTPMAVGTRARATGADVAEIIAARNKLVPLQGRQGTGWDVANAALFLASDEAGFITGACLPVDGGTLACVGLT